MSQISMFDLGASERYKITKPIRLIELFAGIGSQAKALRNLGANFEHYRICEFDKYAVQSYNEVHGTNFTTSDITKIKGADLGIENTDKYEYIMTYSFPCTDLSLAGNQQGMAKGSGTRSGLLWEVERLLGEITELPQILLMENVPQVLNKDFGGWLWYLESKGYTNHYAKLNAKDYGIPQNRERVFMVSILGKYLYEFPEKIPLKLRLKDMLESNVDEKYYIKSARADILLENLDYENSDKKGCDMTINEPKFRDIANTIMARYDNGIVNQKQIGVGVIEPKPTILQQPHGFNKGAELEHCPSITTSCWESNNLLKEPRIFDMYNKSEIKTGICGTITANGNTSSTHCGTFGIAENYRIRKLTPKECWRLMGFSDTDFDKTTVSNSQKYKQAGNSIVVNVLMAIFRELL